MIYRRQVRISLFTWKVVFTALSISLLFSCLAPKKYPKYRPFVYKTTIEVEGSLPNDQKRDIEERLVNQLDDSLRTNIISYGGVYRKLINPPVFDSVNVGRTTLFMLALLRSIGYYAPDIKNDIDIDTLKDQFRVTINFRIRPGKNLTFDSIGFDLQTPALQGLALQSASQSLLRKNKPYSKQIISSELDRLVELFRNNGYYKFSREDLYAQTDTVIAGLINPTLDPFEQVALLEQLKKKRDKPTISVMIRQRPPSDLAHLKKYYFDKIIVFPDLPVIEDTSALIKNDTVNVNGMTFISRSHKIQLPFVAKNIYLAPGELFKQENYYRTSNRFNQLPAWQYINSTFSDSYRADSLLDVTFRMYPAKKQNITYGLETSYNTNDILTTSNLFGIGVNLSLTNRNSFKQSVLTTTTVRGGVQFGSNFIQNTQAGVSHTIIFPQLVSPFRNRDRKWNNVHTVLTLDASYTDLFHFFTARSIDGSWGYQLTNNNTVNKSIKTYLFKPLNIEYTTLNKTDSFQHLQNSIPALELAFKTGLVIGQQFVYKSTRQKVNRTNTFRFSAEQSGFLLGLFQAFNHGDLLRFVKGDIEYVHNINFRKTQLAFHTYGGAGLAYGQAKTLPFYKAYYAGGPNSMRGWQVRDLGVGSSVIYDSAKYAGLKFGDVQLEGNIEYRFPLGTVFGIKVNSALYTDVGNIWNRKPINSSAAAIGSDFNIGRFYNELAVDAGTGLRLDFNFFIIRLDWAFKLKDPQRLQYSERWFYALSPGSGQFQLGIGYPF